MGHLSWMEVIRESWLILFILTSCSVLSFTVIFQKIVFLFKIKGNLTQLRTCISSKSESSFVKNSISGFSNPYLSKIFSDKTENVERRIAEFSHVSKKGLWVLGTLGNAAPFIGLLGTVFGIIKSFRTMSIEGAGGFSVVAAGISEALIATAGGLVVAIIASVFFNYFNVKIKELNQDSRFLREELKDEYGI